MSVSPQKIAEQALKSAKKAGASGAEAYVSTNRELTVEVRDGRTESVKQADTRGLGLRVFVNGSVALVYTSDFGAKALDDLAKRAVVLAKSTPPDDANVLAEPQDADAAKLALHDPAVASLGPDDLIQRVVAAEQTARAIRGVTGTQYAGGFRADAETCIANSRGVSWHYPTTIAGFFLGVLAEDADSKQRSGGDGTSRRFVADLRAPEEIGKEAAMRAVRMVGAKKVPTEKLPVLMHRDIASNWIGQLFEAFSGEQIFKKASYLSDKMGEKIGSDLLTIVDDPLRPRVVGGAPCDDEGTATRRLVLLDKGVVKNFAYDLRWAKKAGAQSTGHGLRDYQSSPGIGAISLYVENGATPVEEMIRGLDRAFYITDTGAFGYDPATGGWSYQAAGLMIEKGSITTPVTDVSLASDTLTMLQGIRQVGNDLQQDGGVNSPHLLIEEMALSGT